MEGCLFCNIINGDIPSECVYENDYVYAFKDIDPVSPVHILIIPKEHIASTNEITGENSVVISKIFEAAAIIAKENSIDGNGYRIVTNCGELAGQTVGHLHFHLIGGRDLSWPPG